MPQPIEIAKIWTLFWMMSIGYPIPLSWGAVQLSGMKQHSRDATIQEKLLVGRQCPKMSDSVRTFGQNLTPHLWADLRLGATHKQPHSDRLHQRRETKKSDANSKPTGMQRLKKNDAFRCQWAITIIKLIRPAEPLLFNTLDLLIINMISMVLWWSLDKAFLGKSPWVVHVY